MLDADVEGIPLHVLGAAPVSCLQDLDDVVHADISLQVVLAKDLQTVVGKYVERGRGEEIKGVLWRHPHLPVVDVPQQTADTLPVGF